MTARRYCLITPCRDEARFAARTIEAVLRQSILPARWVIVDDGSTDQTPKILKEFAEKYPFIQIVTRADRGDRVLGRGVIEAFDDGYATIDPGDFDYICKFDLDLDLPPSYFEKIIQKMEEDPRLGTFSGKPYYRRRGEPAAQTQFPLTDLRHYVSEKCGDENSVGMIKFYRTECFRQIGGFVPMLMWDGIDCHRCRMLGWVAMSTNDPSIRFEHLRPMGTSHKSWWTGRVRHGVGQWYMGTGPIYMLVSAAYRMGSPPMLVGGAAMFWGYLHSAVTRRPRYEDVAFRRFLRAYQRSCLLRGKRRATQALNRRQAAQWGRPASQKTAPAPSAPTAAPSLSS